MSENKPSLAKPEVLTLAKRMAIYKPGCWVYVISEGHNSEFVKIGMTNNPEMRCFGLQTGNPRTLHIAHAVCFRSRRVAKTVEYSLHAELSAYKTKNEWFCIATDVATEHLKRIAIKHKRYLQDQHAVHTM